MRFLSVGPEVCLQLPSDSTLRWTPLLFSYTFPTTWACSGLTPVRARPWRANAKKGGKIRLKSGCGLRMPTSLSLTGKHGTSYSESGRENADPLKWVRWICFPAWSIVPIVESGIIFAGAEAGTKNSMFTPVGRITATRRIVLRIPSRSWRCVKSCWRKSGVSRRRQNSIRNSFCSGRRTSTIAKSKGTCQRKTASWKRHQNALPI